MILKRVIVRLLREVADRIDNDECDLTDAEAMQIMASISHTPMSKDQACRYLNISRATFDNHVRDGLLPQGRKRTGYKELTWYRDELDEAIRK